MTAASHGYPLTAFKLVIVFVSADDQTEDFKIPMLEKEKFDYRFRDVWRGQIC